MSILEIRRQDAFAGLTDRIDRWCEELLRSYLDEFPVNRNSASKDIHDAVWGTVVLNRWELYCLDSPLFQRLRYIRQLGVAHFLFPSTGYSRFEHTIGCVEQASQMFAGLRPAGDQAPRTLGSDDARYALRLAALFHDVGHSPFSHVTEKFYALHPEVSVARELFSQELSRDISASELVSILIVSSQAGQDLIRLSNPGIVEWPLGTALIEFICGCIAGSTRATFPNAYIAQILNGPIDCDKLDYLARDARMAGTPIMLDAQRLRTKLRTAPITDRERGQTTYVLGIDVSGARALEEMTATRVFLYDKLYFHHKVQAAEELIRKALHVAEAVDPSFRDPAFLLQFSDEQLLDLHGLDTSRYTEAKALLDRVRYRALPKRAFAFAPRFALPAPEYLVKLWNPEGGDVRRGKFESFTAFSGLESQAARLDLATRIDAYSEELGHIDSGTFVAWARADSVVGAGDIHSVDADGVAAPINQLFDAKKWAGAYSTSKQTGYVFASNPTPKIFLAAERVLSERGVWGDSRVLLYSKAKATEVEKERTRVRAEFSDDEGWIRHRLSPTWLKESDSTERIARAAERLAPLLSPVQLNPRKWLESWLWQFEDSDLQESALRVVESFHIYDRQERAEIFGAYIADRGRDGLWSYLSSPDAPRAKSAELLGYFLKDLGADHPEAHYLTGYSPTQIRACGRLRLFDDCCCTGAQAISLIASWFGVASMVRSPRDAAPAPLPADYQAAIREIELEVFFLVSRQPAVDALRAAASALGLKLNVYYGADFERRGEILDAVAFDTPASGRRIRAALQARGEQLLSHRTEAWGEDRVKSFALGYDSLGALFGFEYSVPSATVTPLWESRLDQYDGWLPLTPRYPSAVARHLNPKLVGPADSVPEIDPRSDY